MERNRSARCNLMALLLVATCAYPATIAGQSSVTERLKRDNPNQLYVAYYQSGECPFTEASIESMIDGLLVRSRLKPISMEEWQMDLIRFNLNVRVSCDDDNFPPYLFNVSTRFSEIVTLQKPLGPVAVLMDHIPGYDRHGTYNAVTELSNPFVRNFIRDSVEDALMDYLKANFDL